jgi:DNA-binding helix-hairpin-helix protein with protein kinase domain
MNKIFNWQNLSLGTPINIGSESIFVDMKNLIGTGAQAHVLEVEVDNKKYAAKIFHEPTDQIISKVVAMIENPTDIVFKKINGFDFPTLTWPIKLIYDVKSREAVGYLMHLVDLKDSFTLDHFYDHNLRKKLSSPEDGALSCRLEIAKNLSEVIADLHTMGHYCVDLKPQNIRVFKTVHAVTLIDCDGFSIVDKHGVRHPAYLLSTDYIAPEVTNKCLPIDSLGEEQDLYALAVIIFQLLNQGLHPYQGIIDPKLDAPATNDEKAAKGLYPYGILEHSLIRPSPQSIHKCLDTETRKLLDSAFVEPVQLLKTVN